MLVAAGAPAARRWCTGTQGAAQSQAAGQARQETAHGARNATVIVASISTDACRVQTTDHVGTFYASHSRITKSKLLNHRPQKMSQRLRVIANPTTITLLHNGVRTSVDKIA